MRVLGGASIKPVVPPVRQTDPPFRTIEVSGSSGVVVEAIRVMRSL
jgi:hypothetical protein